ncbi:Igsf10 [Columba guinea]|nr:Igsf10 [Columba guinea]
MTGTRRGPACCLGTLLALCLAAPPAATACPRLCACYVPTEVHCTFRYFTAVPPHIPPDVERINLGYNRLLQLTETDFSGLEKLELLMLHSNEINTIPDRVFSDLYSLQVLKMSYNKVRVLQQDVFYGLKSLVRLHMDHNKIEFVNPNVFYGLTSLRLVHLEGNLLKQLHPDTFVTLRYSQIFKISLMKHIYLSDNVLTSLPHEMFSYLPELESIYLHGNPWSCDCRLQRFAQWAQQRADVIKCKKDRSSGAQQCPVCASPKNQKGRSLAAVPAASLACGKPAIHGSLKSRNLTLPADGDASSVSPKDFVAPLGSVVLNMTDQAGSRGNLVCDIQRPKELSPISLDRDGNSTVLRTSFSASLVCGIDYEQIQQLWGILALYSSSPLKLERNVPAHNMPSYKYKQIHSEKDELFTNIEAELRAEPSWLMQSQVALQLDRTATTLSTLHIQYFTDAQIILPSADKKQARNNWIIISRDNQTQTEHTVLVGGTVQLECRATGDPAPAVEWILADGSKVRAPHISEDGRIMVVETGTLTLRMADTFDTGLYHCIGTNGNDADALTFRITVVDPDVGHSSVNGAHVSASVGSTLDLPCTSTAVPDAAVSWVLPEHEILRHSVRNKHVFDNGTLRIQGVTERDSGYYTCVAANQYGVDLLVLQVLVREDETTLQTKHVAVGEGDEGNGSGDAVLAPAVTQNHPAAAPEASAAREESAAASRGRVAPSAQQRNSYGRTAYRLYRDRSGRRFRGHRRQFGSSARRVDPQRWAAFLEKTKRNPILVEKRGEVATKPPVEVHKLSEAPGDEEEASGDVLSPEEEFMIPSTVDELRGFTESVGKISTKTDEKSVVSVSEPSHDYAHSAQKRVTPEPPLASTAITHQQLPNTQDITTRTPQTHQQHGKRRKTSGRRRLVRPGRIPGVNHSSAHYGNGKSEDLPTAKPQSYSSPATTAAKDMAVMNLKPAVAPIIAPQTDTKITKSKVFRVGRKRGTDAAGSRGEGRWTVFANGTLAIARAGLGDRGQYLCTAGSPLGTARLLATLAVLAYPPRIAGARRLLTARPGQRLALRCPAEGRPPPSISWLLANQTHLSGSSPGDSKVHMEPDGTLVIEEVTVYDRGLYTCTAKNPAGTDTLAVKLQVVAAPPAILEEKRQRVEGAMGENLKLPCSVQGTPQPAVHWVLSDGTVVKPLQLVKARLFLFANGTLHISNVGPADSGNYECIATSSTGSERRVVNLVVEHRDTLPKIATASQEVTQLNFGDKLLLNCTATGEPRPRIIWRLPSKALVDQFHRMGSRIRVYPNGSLVIEAVTEKDAGDYLCVARNKIGDDLILMKVSITMKPAKIDQKQYFRKLVPYGKDFQVDCKASGSPAPEISWSLPDGTVINNAMLADDSGHRSRRYILFDNGTLYLNKAGVAEGGDYTCYAQNTLGRDEMKVHITVIMAAPRIKHNYKTYIKAKAGDTALLDCEAVGEPKPKIFWLLPSSDMISSSTARHILHGNGSLSVGRVTPLDAGEYMCVARNPGGDDTKLYKLDVVAKPPVINGLHMNKTIMKVTAVRHAKKHIDCRAEGTPPPQITWIMPDNIFLTAPYYGSRIAVHKNGTLEIRNIRPSDTAEFICVARNDAGESVLVVQLEVLEMLRRPMFKNPFNEKIIATPGKTTTLNCSVDGNPPPDISWMLPNGTWFARGIRTPQFLTGSTGTLTISSPNRDTAGRYRCAARNKVGYIEKLIVLELGQQPTIVAGPEGPVTGVSGQTLSLHCLADGRPKPSTAWTLPGGRVLDRPQISGRYTLLENGTLLVREATVRDRGNYVCEAHNSAGVDSVTVPVAVVASPPRITRRPPRTVRTLPGAAVQLRCAALGTPTPHISWELPDRSVLSTGHPGTAPGHTLLPPGTLLIPSPRPRDSGAYIISNSVQMKRPIPESEELLFRSADCGNTAIVAFAISSNKLLISGTDPEPYSETSVNQHIRGATSTELLTHLNVLFEFFSWYFLTSRKKRRQRNMTHHISQRRVLLANWDGNGSGQGIVERLTWEKNTLQGLTKQRTPLPRVFWNEL